MSNMQKNRIITLVMALCLVVAGWAQDTQSTDSTRVDSLSALGLSHYARGAYQRCVDVLDPLAQQFLDLKTSPLPAEAYHALYYSYQRLGRRPDMFYWGQKCLQKNADDAEILADMARLYNEEEKPDKAISLAGPYNLRHPEHLLVARQYAHACFQNMYFELARPIYRQLLREGLRTFDVAYSLGLCYFQDEAYDSAYVFLKQAAEINHFQNNNCLYRLGISSIKAGHAEEGVEYINKVLDQLTPKPELLRSLHEELAEGYAQLGRDSLELEELKLVMVHGGYTDTRVLWRVAGCYERIGDVDNARHAYQQLLSMGQMLDMMPDRKRDPQVDVWMRKAEEKLEELRE